MYVLIPFGVPVHAEGAGIIPAGMLFFQQFWFARDLGNREFHGILRHGNGRPREIRHFHGNCLDGNGISRLLRELFGWDDGNDICTGTGKKNISREILQEISRGNFIEEGPGNSNTQSSSSSSSSSSSASSTMYVYKTGFSILLTRHYKTSGAIDLLSRESARS